MTGGRCEGCWDGVAGMTGGGCMMGGRCEGGEGGWGGTGAGEEFV